MYAYSKFMFMFWDLQINRLQTLPLTCIFSQVLYEYDKNSETETGVVELYKECLNYPTEDKGVLAGCLLGFT